MTSITGSVSQSCTSLPFGDAGSCTGTDWGFLHFTDLVHDGESNNEHTLFRQLSTTQGRWLSPDPAGMAVVDLTSPQSLNRYAYALNQPIDISDPLGLDPWRQEPNDASFANSGWTSLTFLDFALNHPVAVIVGWMSVGNCDNCNIPLIGFFPNLSLLPLLADPSYGSGTGPSQCADVTAASLDYSQGGKTHIENLHMVMLVNGAGNQIQVDKAGRPKSQYYFSPQGTAAQNWALVTAINALTFNPASATPKYGNLQFTATVPPENVPVPGARPFIGLEGQPFQPLHARFIPTNTNTLVLHNDCKTVVTSYPGKP